MRHLTKMKLVIAVLVLILEIVVCHPHHGSYSKIRLQIPKAPLIPIVGTEYKHHEMISTNGNSYRNKDIVVMNAMASDGILNHVNGGRLEEETFESLIDQLNNDEMENPEKNSVYKRAIKSDDLETESTGNFKIIISPPNPAPYWPPPAYPGLPWQPAAPWLPNPWFGPGPPHGW